MHAWIASCVLWSTLLLLPACGGDTGEGGSAPPRADSPHPHRAMHGGIVIALSGDRAQVEFVHDAATGTVQLFVTTADGQTPLQLSEPPVLKLLTDRGPQALPAIAAAGGAGPSSRFTCRAAALGATTLRGRIALTIDGKPYNPDIPAGPPHGPKDGVLATFGLQGGERLERKGYLELKLHDDKGDLELWLGQDPRMATPFDVPVGTVVSVTLLDRGDRRVELRVRNSERNEDEAGTPNIRASRTNYFIFPTRDDEDASWLRGKDFSSRTTVEFEAEGKRYRSPVFLLHPHHH